MEGKKKGEFDKISLSVYLVWKQHSSFQNGFPTSGSTQDKSNAPSERFGAPPGGAGKDHPNGL